jgi:hypothetical protein
MSYNTYKCTQSKMNIYMYKYLYIHIYIHTNLSIYIYFWDKFCKYNTIRLQVVHDLELVRVSTEYKIQNVITPLESRKWESVFVILGEWFHSVFYILYSVLTQISSWIYTIVSIQYVNSDHVLQPILGFYME